MIGLQKPAVKTHGSADQQQFSSSIQMLYDIVDKDFTGQIKKAMAK
jgi:fatty acid/phospholipid biosynthesis enzyme